MQWCTPFSPAWPDQRSWGWRARPRWGPTRRFRIRIRTRLGTSGSATRPRSRSPAGLFPLPLSSGGPSLRSRRPLSTTPLGGTAILSAYLPMQGLPPGDWSGEQLTASSQYSNPQSPMAQATAKDEPLEDFVQDYPPGWDGFIQLRLYLGAPDEPSYVQHYPVLNLEISGDTWTAVGGGPVNCSAGNAESLETAVAPPSTTTTVSSSGGGGKASTATTVTSDPPSANRPAAAAGSSSAHAKSGQTSGLATDRPASSSGPAASIFAGLVALLILLVLSALVVVRRRRASQLSSTASETSVKGPQP